VLPVSSSGAGGALPAATGTVVYIGAGEYRCTYNVTVAGRHGERKGNSLNQYGLPYWGLDII
jgi:hypothetical protein